MKTDPLKSKPTVLKRPAVLVIKAPPMKDGGKVTSSSMNFATFDRAGNIYITEWVSDGRVMKLRPVA